MYVRENFMYHPRPVRPCQKPGSLIRKHLCLKNHQRSHQTLYILKPNYPGFSPDQTVGHLGMYNLPPLCCLKENIQGVFLLFRPKNDLVLET